MNKHNISPAGLEKAVAEIKSRHANGYVGLVETMVNQIKQFCQTTTPFDANFVFGCSGGIDSTVVAYLLHRAVGARRVVPVTIPVHKDDEGIEYFQMIKDRLGIEKGYCIPIESTVNGLSGLVTDCIKKDIDRIGLGNIASRLRVNVLYAIARGVNGFVIGTSNRTEFVQGYATKYGTPMSCDFGVIDDLYKTDIRELGIVLGIPAEILAKTPSTGFYKGQSHEVELGATMEEQDCAAYLLFEKRLSVEAIIKDYGASEEFLEIMLERYHQSEHKRILQSRHVSLGGIL